MTLLGAPTGEAAHQRMGLQMFRRVYPVFPTLHSESFASRAVGQPRHLPFPLNEPRHQVWFLGRNALYAGLSSLGLRRGDAVLVPSYTNGMEVAPLSHAGARVLQLPLEPDLQLNLNALERALRQERPKLVVATHYLGFAQPIDAIVELAHRYGAWVLEDCAHAFLAQTPDGRWLGSIGDFAIYSLYKTVALPDGGALVVNHPELPLPAAPQEPEASSSISGAGRLALASFAAGGPLQRPIAWPLAWARAGSRWAFAAAQVERTAAGGMHFAPARLDWGASPTTRWLLERLRYDGVAARRRRNFAYLQQRIAAPGLFQSLPPGASPLFYPVIVEDKQKFRDALAKQGIETIDFWSTWHPATPPEPFPMIGYLRDHVVEVPCLHDFSIDAMAFIADAVQKALARQPAAAPSRRFGAQVN